MRTHSVCPPCWVVLQPNKNWWGKATICWQVPNIYTKKNELYFYFKLFIASFSRLCQCDNIFMYDTNIIIFYVMKMLLWLFHTEIYNLTWDISSFFLIFFFLSSSCVRKESRNYYDETRYIKLRRVDVF